MCGMVVVVHGVLVRVCVPRSVLTFLKSSVHLRVGEKLEGEVTWPWQTGQHFTPTLMQHGTRTSPHTAERRREGGSEGWRERGEREVSSQTSLQGSNGAWWYRRWVRPNRTPWPIPRGTWGWGRHSYLSIRNWFTPGASGKVTFDANNNFN